MTTLEQQLIIFREAYPSVRCTVGSDNIVYKTAKGKCLTASENANFLIKMLDLDLTAIPTTLSSLDSFIVKSIYSEL